MFQDSRRIPQLSELIQHPPGSVGWHLIFNPTDLRLTLERLAVLNKMETNPWFADRLRTSRGHLPVDELLTVLWEYSEYRPALYERLVDTWAVEE